MQANLCKVHPDAAFRVQCLSIRLARVVAHRQEIVRVKQENLSRAEQDMGNINNPYKLRHHLSLKDSLFVGRRDLAKELEGALSQSDRRPTFLLNGERRIGKTSTLKQLLYLLGSRYIPIFYNLQESEIYSSTATFLGTLAESIWREMSTRAMSVDPLKFGILREARQASSLSLFR